MRRNAEGQMTIRCNKGGIIPINLMQNRLRRQHSLELPEIEESKLHHTQGDQFLNIALSLVQEDGQREGGRVAAEL